MSPIQSIAVKQTPLVEKPNHHSRSRWYFRKRLSAFTLLLNIYHKWKHGCIESTMNPIQSISVKQTPLVEKPNHHSRSGWYFRKRLSAFSLLLNIYYKRKYGCIESTMSLIQSIRVKQTPLVESRTTTPEAVGTSETSLHTSLEHLSKTETWLYSVHHEPYPKYDRETDSLG